MSRILLLLGPLLLAGCQTQPAPLPAEPYEVKVPVYIKATPPGELARAYVPTELPIFVSPAHPDAVYALTEVDWRRLQVILRTLRTRDQAWRDWAADKESHNE